MVIGVVPAPADEEEPIASTDDEEAASRSEERDSAPRTGPPTPGLMAIALSVIMVFSVTAVFFGVFAFGLSGLQEQRSQHQLYASFRGLLDPSSEVQPEIGGAIPAGSPVALLNAPQAGIDNVMVVEGTTSGDLLDGPGHRPDTPLPGQAGESILIGKSTTAGAPFAVVTHLRKGDVITVRTGQGRFRYTVQGRLVPGQRPPPIRSDSGLLTLVTSVGAGWEGRLAPNHLVYVDAKLQGKAVAAPKGRPTTVSTANIQGHSDPSAWPFAALWLAALLVGSAICWRLWSRWGLLQTWLVGAPVLFGILWGFSNEAMRFLPNVY